MPKAAPELHLAVQYAVDAGGLPTRPRIRRWVRAACARAAEVTVRFVDAEEGRALNSAYRGKDHATNVLSFAYRARAPLQGDLVLCRPVLAREAAEQGKPLAAHCAHLIVHGMLHLQGYDHEAGTEEAERMEARERRILAGLGFPDPYT